MEVVHSRCCGLDVHKKSISACVMIREHGRLEKLEHRFGTFTRELEDLAAWLAEHKVTHVATASRAAGGQARAPASRVSRHG
jgi:hypothetical protein